MEREGHHWLVEDHKQRITEKELREMLLAGEDTIIYHGRIRRLKAKHLLVGIYEISKEPLQNIGS